MKRSERVSSGLVLAAMILGTLITAGGAALSMAQEEEDQSETPQISRAEVDEACAVSGVHLAVYEDALNAFQQATADQDVLLEEIEIAQGRRDLLLSLAAGKAREVEELRAELEQTAIELYMQHGALSLAPFLGGTPEDVMVGAPYLASGTDDQLADINNYLSSQRDLNRHEEEVAALQSDLMEMEAQQEAWVETLLQATWDQSQAWEELDADCQDLVRRWEIQEARRRAEEARRRAEEARRIAAARAAEVRRKEQERLRAIARASRQSEGIGPIPGLVCPFPGSAFVDSWGDPRSGGRTHKGVDMYGPHGAPLYAAAPGTITITTGGLGGRGLWIHSDTGVAYYYAHLDGWAVSEGQSVSAGQLVGYNGATGNAYGGRPHLHLQLHPSGRETPAYNPYPTMRAAC